MQEIPRVDHLESAAEGTVP